MKQAITYSLKVTLTTLLLCLPVTFAIMMAYLRILPIITSNYSVNVHLDLKDAAVFIALTFCTLLFNMRKINGIVQSVYNKKRIAGNAIMTSIALFVLYLLAFGKLMPRAVDEFLITYGPSFLIMFICLKVFPLRDEDIHANIHGESKIIEPFGQLTYNRQDKAWFGEVSNIHPNNNVELSISAETENQQIDDKVELVKKLASDYDAIIANLQHLIFRRFENTNFEKSLDDIKRMYDLVAVDLKSDNKTWWLVMQPDINVTSLYNHYQRFTMVDREIIWANFNIDKHT
ncbi:hypothetical protein [Pedobacter kyonggii]|uniref:Uncharacterized protein n=1 Tax=Pedobacter kyonggii TaxID=1926871 RepID=A0A4Q9HA71_9SPHI|nr:hypothetical protein [Pedobacter kyonggii]TBO40935.1 hypothetical protein EYS08_16525 [Pedobacter kyonggii]